MEACIGHQVAYKVYKHILFLSHVWKPVSVIKLLVSVTA
jgi:hypothetical protein